VLAVLFTRLQLRTCDCACGESCVHHLHQLLLTANLSLQRACSTAETKHFSYAKKHFSYVTLNMQPMF
jgi:hypothetical protein